MQREDFVHLHLHTEYSLLDGACRIDRVFQRARELGQKAVAITDHGVMYGAISFYKAAKKEGIHPVIGCEVYLSSRSMTEKEANLDRENYHLVLLCENMTGYQNLIHLVTNSFTQGFYQKPRIDLNALRAHHEGLICLSACLAGKIPRLILSGDLAAAEAHALELKDIFGQDSFFLELQDHGIPDQLRVNSALISLSRKTGIGLVATNDVHYLSGEDAKSHDALLCIQTGKTLQDQDRMKFETEEFYFKSTEQMASLFSHVPEAITNTSAIARRCRVEFDFTQAHLPHFQNELGLSSSDYLKKMCYQGLERRIDENKIENRSEYDERLSYELSVIEKMGFCDYFLIVADFVGFAKRNDIYVGPGRGSGAGSLAAWCLDITELDPIAYHLIFERFLNPERVSMPDFDIDFCKERRHEVIEYVSEKYGPEHVAQIITFSTMASRAAVRDVGRVMGMPYAQVDRIVKRIPRFLDMTLKKALDEDKELAKLCESGDAKELMRIAQSLEGMPRNASIHAAGLVLTDKPVCEYVPLAVNTGATVTQYTMTEIADLGLLKIDLLGLRYLTIIRDAVNEIRKTVPHFDVNTIPLDDRDTFAMISRGETAGMFQIESSGMKALMMQMKPESIDDITAAIALYRPGPKDSIPRFLKNKQLGKNEHKIPQLTNILSSTYGCIVYQEQVMEIFRALAGYSFGRADIVRRAMSKKKQDVMEREHDIFLYGSSDEDESIRCEGAIARGISPEAAESIFQEMADFAKYAFNKSHAAAYAVLSYRTAYLKCKFPKEYMAAVLTSQLGSDKYSFYFSECQRMGIRILPPHINESQFSFSISQNALRVGFVGIKNVGDALIENIFKERSTAPFSSFGDFVDRMRSKGLNKKALESLVFSGAMDCFGIARARLNAVIEPMMDFARDASRSALPGQMTLFDTGLSENRSQRPDEYPDIPEFDQKELLRAEKSVCGVYFSGHPLSNYTELSKKLGAVNLIQFQTEPEKFRDGDQVLVLCLVESLLLKQVKNGSRMAFVQAEDQSGRCEIVVFPNTLSHAIGLLEEGSVVAILGKINTKDEEIKILADQILPPEEAKPISVSNTSSALDDKKTSDKTINFDKVSKLFLRFPKKESKIEKRAVALLRIFPGNTPCYFYYLDTEKLFHATGLSCQLTPKVFRELQELLGSENIGVK